MNTLVRRLVLGALLGAAGLCCSPTPAKADPEDRYWRHYWRWYDSTYRPYYHRRFYAPPPAYAYPPAVSPAPYYGGTTTYYGPAPAYPYSSGAVVGPVVRYGWW